MARKILITNLFTSGTKVLTKEYGAIAVEDIPDRTSFNVWNGSCYSIAIRNIHTEFKYKEQQELMHIVFDNGHTLIVSKSFWFNLAGGSTAKAKDLKSGDKLKGWKCPDTTSDTAVVDLVSTCSKDYDASTLYSIQVPTFNRVMLNGIMVPGERG